MVMSRRVFTREFKLAALKELESGKSVGYVARRLEVNPNLLYRWRREFKEQPTAAFSGQGKQMLAESRESCTVGDASSRSGPRRHFPGKAEGWPRAGRPSLSGRSARWPWRMTF